MIVTITTSEPLDLARNLVSRPAQSAHNLLHRIAGANVTDTEQTEVEQMSLAEILYFALMPESRVTF